MAVTHLDYYRDLRLSFQLCFALYAATHKLARIYSHLLEPLGLTFPQALAMLVLWEKSPLAVGEVATALDLDNGSLTPLLKRLETACFVRRVRDAGDQRRVNVHVTQKGLDLKEPVILLRRDLLRALNVADEDIAALRTNINRFSEILSRAAD